MAVPIVKVPVYKVDIEGVERNIIPATNVMRPRNKVISIPSLRLNFGANGEKTAKATKGRVVRRPAKPLDKCMSSRINPMRGPTDVIAGRKLAEIAQSL